MRCAPQVAHHVTITQPEIYEYVQNNMWHLPLDELKSELEVSKRIARALRDGVPINLSYDRLMVLESNIAFIRRFCLKSRIRCVIEDSRYGELYVKLNRYLAKVIAEMPQDIAKITRGGWTTSVISVAESTNSQKGVVLTKSTVDGNNASLSATDSAVGTVPTVWAVETALKAKQDKLTAGTGVSITDGTVSVANTVIYDVVS